jgi:hypothetical protein
MMERESAAAPRGGAAKRPLAPNAQRQEMTRLHLATLCLGVCLLGGASAGCASTTGQTTATEPRAPQVASAEDAIARADAERGTLCGADVSLASIASTVWPFPEGGAWLAHVVCFEGAYQPSARLALVDAAGVVTPLGLPLVGDDGTLGSTMEVAAVSVEGDLLTEESHDRGLGDCGRRVRARLVGDGRLVLVEHRQRPCDDSAPVLDRDQWPLRSVVAGSVVAGRVVAGRASLEND